MDLFVFILFGVHHAFGNTDQCFSLNFKLSAIISSVLFLSFLSLLFSFGIFVIYILVLHISLRFYPFLFFLSPSHFIFY